MKWVKGIVSVLKCFAVITLYTVIKPNWDQCQKCKALASKEICLTSEMKLIGKASQHLRVDIPQEDKLSCITQPVLLLKEIENQNRQNTSMIKVYHCNQSQNITKDNRCETNKHSFPWFTTVLIFLIPANQTKRNQETPKNILMYRVK